MDHSDTDVVGAGGKASFIALAGTIAFVIGVIPTALLGPLGRFFMALGGVTVLASPVVWSLMVWHDRSDEESAKHPGDWSS